MYPGRSDQLEGPDAHSFVKGAASLALLCALILPPAQAQDAPERPAIEEIIVTATKREASVRDVAGSVTALTGEQLEDAGLQDVNDIVDAVPGVNLVEGTAQSGQPSRITIRGIAAGVGQNDTAGVFIDETPFTDVFFAFVTADANPFDMSSVEVIKGPVGTLFGGSALNGGIRYIPQKPVLGEWQYKVFNQYSTNNVSEDLGRVSGVAINVPIHETLALRVVGNDRESEGWIDSLNQSYKAKDVNKTSQQSLRAILRWAPLEPLDASLMLLDQDTFVHDVGYGDTASQGRYERTATAQPSPSLSEYQTWQLKGSWAFDWADLVLVASNSDKRYGASADTSFLAESDPATSTAIGTAASNAQSRSQELRMVSSGGGDWDWLGGIYNYKYSVLGANGLVTGGSTGSQDALILNYDADVTERAMFGEVNWRFTEGFELTGGLRLYEFSYLGEVSNPGAACVITDPTCPLTGFEATVPLDRTERGTSPKLNLKWQITDELMSYINASRGFRFGGANGLAHPEVPTVYGSDSLWSYEVGTRADWLDGSLVTDATFFFIDWTDAQFSTSTSDGAFSYVDNVAAVEAIGMESQVDWLLPVPGVRLTLTSAYAKVETAEDYTAPSGATTPAGTPWPRAPKWQTEAKLGWNGEFGNQNVGASLTHRYYSKAIETFFANSGQVFGYANYDLQFTVKNATGGWWPDLALNLNNLTNTQGTTLNLNGAAPESGNPRNYTTPRNISLRMSLVF